MFSISGETDADLDTNLRPLWTLVALSARGCAPDHCPLYIDGWTQGQTALVSSGRRDDRCAGGNNGVQNAVESCRRQFPLWRINGALEHCMDRDRGGVSLRYFGQYR